MSLTLFYHPLSSYCQKVLIALYETGVPFQAQVIDLGSETDRACLGAHWPLCKFPVIHDVVRGRSLPESSTIIEYLDNCVAGGRRMVPTTWESAIEVRLWDRIFDNYVQTPMQRIVADKLRQSNADMSEYRSLLEVTYRAIDNQVSPRTWIASDEFSMADCAAAPALFYANTVLALPPGLGHLCGYFERLMARSSVKRAIEEARPYFHFYPFAEAIPERFKASSNSV